MLDGIYSVRRFKDSSKTLLSVISSLFLLCSPLSRAQTEFRVGNEITNSFLEPNYLDFSDLDNDGDIDIITVSKDGDYRITWLENLGNLSFSKFKLIGDSVSSSASTSTKVGDIDGDGFKDVITAADAINSFGYSMTWFKNLGNNNFDELHREIPLPEDAMFIDLGDLNNDGSLDLLIAYEDALVWRPNQGNGTFPTEIVLFDSYQINDIRAIQLLDVDNDGDLDALSVSHQSGAVKQFTNDGFGNFVHVPIYESTQTGPVCSN